MPETSSFYQTPLHNWHKAHGARMTPFANWSMPLQYGRVAQEHHQVRNAAGLFDVSHMGLLWITAEPLVVQALEPLVPQALPTPGRAIYTQFLNESGGILDDLLMYHVTGKNGSPDGQDGYWLVVNAINTSKILNWLNWFLPAGSVRRLNDVYGLLALQGPRFAEVLDIPAAQLPTRFGISSSLLVRGFPPLPAARTGYTGEDGLEIFCPAEQLVSVWQTLTDRLAPMGGGPAGLAARDTLRLEASLPLYGHELTEDVTPIEAGLGWSVAGHKAFMGDVIRRKAPQRFLVCLTVAAGGSVIPRQGDCIIHEGLPFGVITSGSISPTLGHPVAMGYLQTALPVGTMVELSVRNRQTPAMIAAKPLYHRREV